ncbi:mandelate racemase/muconate lactonizing enzyme family protein [Alteromonas sp. 14N.309.X.WAT.G.H12]|uniref:mandelate racemase/muconate lactonizing enzyme family protein n=1 Tax=Alteromonas sp. 14N.309.X.WAT.G.H12 TaxID=3120824 RepID=UPI002FD1BD69
MNSTIQHARIHCFDFPRDRIIGDSQISSSHVWIGALELFDSNGMKGLGFFQSLSAPLPDASFISALFSQQCLPKMRNRTPEGLIHQLSRPRGGNIQPLPYHLDQAIDQALWDLAAKRVNQPLYQFFGGTKNKVKAYGSGVCYHMTDQQVFDFYSAATKHNFSGYKVKVGHPDIERDIARLQLVTDAVGTTPLLMVDANEAWSPKEAIRRIRAFENAGFPIYWVEDPILRHDTRGLIEMKAALKDTYINAGEYLNLAGKKALVDNDAADVINIHGDFSGAHKIAWLCAEKGISVSLGNTPMELGAHIASALPETLYTEHSMLNWDDIVAKPFVIENGHIVLPDTPGHGLSLCPTAIKELSPSIAESR